MVYIDEDICDFRVSIYGCMNSNYYKIIYIINILFNCILTLLGPYILYKRKVKIDVNLLFDSKNSIIFYFFMFHSLQIVYSLYVLYDIYSKEYGTFILEILDYIIFLFTYIGFYMYKFEFLKSLNDHILLKKIKILIIIANVINQINLLIITIFLAYYKSYLMLTILFYYKSFNLIINFIINIIIGMKYLKLIKFLFNNHRITNNDLNYKYKIVKKFLLMCIVDTFLYLIINILLASDKNSFTNIYMSKILSFFYILFIQITDIISWSYEIYIYTMYIKN